MLANSLAIKRTLVSVCNRHMLCIACVGQRLQLCIAVDYTQALLLYVDSNVVEWVDRAENEANVSAVRSEVNAYMEGFPLY